MAVLMKAEIPGMTVEGIAGMSAALNDRMRVAPGFVIHTNGPIAGGWRVIEVWDSEDAFTRWFESTVKPTLPPGIAPQVSFDELHDVVTA